MNTTFLQNPENLQWLRAGALRGVPLPPEYAAFQSALLVGNEDAPDHLQLYRAADPSVNDHYLRVTLEGAADYCELEEVDGRTGARSVPAQVLRADPAA